MSWIFGRDDYARELPKASSSYTSKKGTGMAHRSAKLPTEKITKPTTCPICSKRGYNRSKSACSRCGFVYQGDRPFKMVKASELTRKDSKYF